MRLDFPIEQNANEDGKFEPEGIYSKSSLYCRNHPFPRIPSTGKVNMYGSTEATVQHVLEQNVLNKLGTFDIWHNIVPPHSNAPHEMSFLTTVPHFLVLLEIRVHFVGIDPRSCHNFHFLSTQ